MIGHSFFLDRTGNRFMKPGYSLDVFDLEPVLIQPAYIQRVEPSDKRDCEGAE
jgi:hypothetical protein